MFSKSFWWLVSFENYWFKPYIITIIIKVWCRQFGVHVRWHLRRRRKHLEIFMCDVFLIIKLFILEYWFIESCKNCLDSHVPLIRLLPIVTSDTGRIQYRNQETDIVILLLASPYSVFTIFLTCIHLCVYIVLCNFIPCIDSCNYHYNQDIELLHQHDKTPCCFFLVWTPTPCPTPSLIPVP